MEVVTLKCILIPVNEGDLDSFKAMLEKTGGEILLKDKLDLRLTVRDVEEAKTSSVLKRFDFHLQEDGAVVIAET